MNKKVIVIGDAILDEYINIDPIKVSDEAHVITSKTTSKKFVLGGATNVARNISSLGGECFYMGIVSPEFKSVFNKLFKEYDIKSYLIEIHNAVQIKTRVVSNRGAQICRYDSNYSKKGLNEKQICDFLLMLENIIIKYDFIIISKYYEHFISSELIIGIVSIANKHNKKIIVDNRDNDYYKFKKVDFYKANFNEFKKIYNANDIVNETEEIIKLVKSRDMISKCLVITRSNLSTIIFQKVGKTIKAAIVDVKNVEVKDVSGAGDTFVASFALNYNDDVSDCVKKCHEVCNVVVRKMGTSVVWTYEINNEINITKLCEQLRKNNKKIVFTNGVFDIIHSGHVKILKTAKQNGDYLIVGINSDSSVKKLKGPERPINNQDERKTVLEAFRFVDKVIVFNDIDCKMIIKKIKPDVYIKGGDYNLDNLPEKSVLKYIKKVIFVDLLKDRSSTNIINKIKG